MARNLLIVFCTTILAVTFLAGCASFQKIQLKENYDFQNKNVITVYVAPSGNDDLDDTYARVMCLDLQARGYKAINANKKLKANSEQILWTSHRQTADTIMSKSYLPISDIIAIVKTKWDSIQFVTDISKQNTFYGQEVTGKGFNVKRLYSEVAFYDRSNREPIMAYSAIDTTHIYAEKEGSGLYYPERPWMIIARQLTNNLTQIKICHNDNSAPSKNLFKVCFWVDESYRQAFPQTWRNRVKLRALYANDILRNQLGIELVVSGIKEWNSHFQTSLDNTIKKLARIPNPDENTIRIGITLDKKLKTNWTDRSNIGFAYPLKTDAIITAEPVFPGLKLWDSLEEAITLVHEVGHLFGAVHVTNKNSVMYPSAVSITYEFDEINRKIINRMKNDYMKADDELLLKDYINELINIKNTSPKNTFPVLHAISSVFVNLYADESYQFQNPDKLSQFLFEIIPDSVYALAIAGQVEYEQNKLSEAEKFFSRVIKLDPEFAEVHWYLSNIFKSWGEDKEAELHHKIAKPYVKFWVLK